MKKTIYRPLMTAAVVSLMLSACSSNPKEVESLEQARADYSEASQDLTVVKHAPEELDIARNALSLAEQQWKQNEDVWRVEHYSYLTSQRVRIANLIAESKETDRELEEMALERRNIALDLREAELVKAKQEALDLQQQLAALQAQPTERGMVLTLGDVLFDLGEATLAPGAARNIVKIASFLDNYPERTAIIEGHTDSMGEDDFNMNLSRERALAVRKALADAGINGKRMSIQGFGETLPVASNDTATGRQENRRVEIIFPDEVTQISEFEE